MKTILFIEFCPIGGSTKGLLTEIEYILNNCRNKYSPVVIGYPGSILGPHAEQYKYKFFEFEATGLEYLWGSPIRTMWLYFLAMYKIFIVALKNRPDLIHCNHYMWSIYANPIGFLFRIPVVIHLKDVWMLEPKFSRLLMKFYSGAYYIAVSKYVKRLFVEKYKIDKKITILIYDGINTSIAPNITTEFLQKKVDSHRKRIIMISRISVERDIEIFIDVAALITRSYPGISFHHYGFHPNHSDRTYLQLLKQRVNSLGMRGRMQFHNYEEDPRKVAMLFQNSYLSLVTARQFALPNVAIESLLCGTPVIALDVGGNREVIRRDCLVKQNSPLLYADLIDLFLGNSNKYIKYGLSEIKFCKKRFDSDAQYKKVVDLYESVLRR